MPSYLAGRGIGARAQQHWLIGYAPAGPGALVHHLRAAGYPDALILAAGLARRSHRGYLTDTFRDRAVLPICSPHGTRVGFIGRAAEQAGPAVPKYLNSPTTGLYDKSQALFGLWQAHDSLAAGAVPVIAEGPLDAIAIAIASDAGGRSRGGAAGTGRVQYAPVALCGSALTVRQVETLARTCDLSATGVLVALDNDEAGRRAAVRAFWMLSPHASRVEAVDLSPASDSGGQVIGHDPAQILRDHGLAALSAVLAHRRYPLADLVVDATVRRWSRLLGFAEGQIGGLRAVAPIVAAMPPAEVGRQVARIAAQLELDYATVTMAVTDALQDQADPGAP